MNKPTEFAPGTPEAAMLESLRTFQVGSDDAARRGLVRHSAKRNPGLSQWPIVLRHAVQAVNGDVERIGGVIYNCCTKGDRWAEAAESEERRQAARELVNEIRGTDASGLPTLTDRVKGAAATPDLCTETNPYGWRRHPMPGEDHAYADEWNPWRQCDNGPEGGQETRPTNPDHPDCCIEQLGEQSGPKLAIFGEGA